MANRTHLVWWTIVLGKALLEAISGSAASVFFKYMLTQFWGIPFWLPNFINDASWVATAGIGALLGGVHGAISGLLLWRRNIINRAVAENAGLSYDDFLSGDEIRSFPKFTFSQYKDLAATQRMAGKLEDRSIDVFDVKYTTESGGSSESSSSVHQVTVFRFPKAGLGIVSFTNRPRTRVMDLLLAFAGLPVLELSPDEFADEETVVLLNQFRKLYLILPSKTASSEEVQKIFHPFLLMWLTKHPGWHFESNGEDLIAWKSDKRFVGPKRLLQLEELQEWLALVDGAALAATHSPSSKAKMLVFNNDPKSFSEKLSLAMGRGVYGAIGFGGVAYLIVGIFWILERSVSPLWFLVLFPAGLFGFLAVGFCTLIFLMIFDSLKSFARRMEKLSKENDNRSNPMG